MDMVIWHIAAITISIPTSLPFSGASLEEASSPIPGHVVHGITGIWNKGSSQWLTITWWQFTLPPYPGQPVQVLESWPVLFLDQQSSASRIRSAVQASIKPGSEDGSYLLFGQSIKSTNAYLHVTAGGISKETFNQIIQSIRLNTAQPIPNTDLICQIVPSS